MENHKIVPPHLNAEAYRTNSTDSKNISYLDFIRLHSDGSVLVGCSELTGRYWNGGASVFNNVAEAQQHIGNAKKCISLISGSADGCFVVDSSKILLCEDSGAVSIWTSNEGAWKEWSADQSVSEHDAVVLAVDCLDPGKEYVTAGADGNVKVWDIGDMICMKNYRAAHSGAIFGVAVKPKSTKSFATASADTYVSLWDDNVTKPVLELVENDCGVRCLQWVDENLLAYGDEAGILRVVDVRNSENVQTISEFPAAVHKIAVESESQRVAVCCDNKTVYVCDISESEVVYQNRSKHSNYIRGVTWDVKDKNLLYAIGETIESHTVS